VPVLFVFGAVLSFTWSTVKADEYRVLIAASSDFDDRIGVSIELPELTSDTSVFVFPVTVPGTYEEHLWWRLVHNFRAFDASGSPLPTSRSADSQFVIPRQTVRVSYRLDDSFDDLDSRVNIFQPAGTSFQGDTVFVLNHGGVVGYVDGKQTRPYTVRVERSPEIATFTALQVLERGYDFDVYTAPTYDALVDGPALLCRADTATYQSGGAQILVAVCGTPNGKPLAPAFAKGFKRATDAVADFLPSMPVNRYTFLVYLWDKDTVNVKRTKYSVGALEHNTSSMYFLFYSTHPKGYEEIAAHEFLHILVPLHLHSKEIGRFNFRFPAMSKHLWLYEGVTEYFANQAGLRGRTSTEKDFLQAIQRGARSAAFVPDTFSLTSFSKNVLLHDNQKIYPVIYQIGPANALLLDILLRSETNEKMGVLELVYGLMGKYGKAAPFDDDSLFADIGTLTTPTVQSYLETYVGGAHSLPFAQYLPLIGWEFADSTQDSALGFGIHIDRDASVADTIYLIADSTNVFGFKTGDILMKVNGRTINEASLWNARRLWRATTTDPLTVTVQRDGHVIEKTAKPTNRLVMQYNVIKESASPTESQLKFRKLVLYGIRE